MILLLPALLSCADLNRPPRIQAFNGYPVVRDAWGDTSVEEQLLFEPGDSIDFSLDVLDPELQQLAVWWPESPPGFDFPYDGLTGTWEVPDDFDQSSWSFTTIVEDPFGETDTLQVWFWGDAGYYYEPYRDTF